MNKLLFAAAGAILALQPQLASAQAIPPAVVAVVDLDRIYRDCTACKVANGQLESQANALRARQQALATPMQNEARAIQTAINALGGRAPDAALTNRIQALQTRQTQANTELSNREQAFQRVRAHVLQQINTKLDPLLTQVMARRGANVMIESGSTLRINQSVDVTSDVLTALNASLRTLSVTAPPAAAPARR